MARLANISGKDAVKAFEKAGWRVVGQVGSHVVMTKTGMRANLSIPQHKELSLGTLRALIRHSGMTVQEFVDVLCDRASSTILHSINLEGSHGRSPQ